MAAVLTSPLAAQKKPKPIERPDLGARADTNDAYAYMKYGWRPDVDWKETYAAFYWAYRLQPDDVSILAALHQAYWMRQTPQWRSLYNEGAEFVLKSKEAKLLDSLRYEVAIRNPMVYLRGDCYRWEGVDDERDDWLAAAILFDYGCYKEAAERYAKAIERYPRRIGLRLDRAHALYRSNQYGEAVTELQAVLDTLHGRDAKYLSHQYQTRAIIEFMLGQAYLRARNLQGAREAFGRALTEDLSLYWMHARLAELALNQRDTKTALAEYEQAIALKDNDGVLLHDYGVALSAAKQYAEAEPHFRRAIELEPYFATAYYNLAVALDRQEKFSEAREAYREFLKRAPRREAKMIITTQSRVKALEAQLASGTTAETP